MVEDSGVPSVCLVTEVTYELDWEPDKGTVVVSFIDIPDMQFSVPLEEMVQYSLSAEAMLDSTTLYNIANDLAYYAEQLRSQADMMADTPEQMELWDTLPMKVGG